MLILFILLYMVGTLFLTLAIGWPAFVISLMLAAILMTTNKVKITKYTNTILGIIVGVVAILAFVVAQFNSSEQSTVTAQESHVKKKHVEKGHLGKKHTKASSSNETSASEKSSSASPVESASTNSSSESSVETATTSYSESANTDYSYSQQADSSDASKISYADYSSNDQYTPTAQGTNPGDGQTAPTQVNETGPIKASVDGWYHVPGQAYYDRVNRVAQYFQTEQEAIDAGYKRSRY